MFISKELLQTTIENMEWMLVDIDYRNKDLDKIEDSKEVTQAKKCLKELKEIKNQENHYVQNG